MSLWRGSTYVDLIGHIRRTNLEHFELRNQCTSDGTWLSCDATMCNLIVKLLGRNPKLKRFILLDSGEVMLSIGWSFAAAMAIIDAAVTHPALRYLNIDCSDAKTAQPRLLSAVAKLIRANRKIRSIQLSGFDCPKTLDEVPELLEVYRAMRGNWTVTQLELRCECGDAARAHMLSSHPSIYKKILNRATINVGGGNWRAVHSVTHIVAMGLRPLGLSPYVVLWILDWLPWCKYIYVRDGDEFDPHRRRKLALIERIAQAR
jgi:hypothetical protein